MKVSFSLLSVLPLALSVAAAPSADKSIEARADCNLIAHYETDWIEYANRRYRVAASFTGNSHNRDMLQTFCDSFYAAGLFVSISNPQCYHHDGGVMYADVSYIQGGAGYNQYKDTMQRTVNEWRARTSCDVDSRW
ncbi:hypothetical protein NHJ13734_009669 [Beauveria thailandica]